MKENQEHGKKKKRKEKTYYEACLEQHGKHHEGAIID
jgi:hypothetical protein